MKSENHFKNNWKKVTAEKANIDPDIDFRLWTNIQSSISEILKRRNIFFAAAVIIPLLIVSTFFFFQKSQKSAKEYHSATRPLFITLDDGSLVKMKPGSTLHTDKAFGEESRDVRFAGEAFFEVKENKKLPFRVFGKDFSAEVLGTKFTLVSTANIKKVELKEGSVKIIHNGKNMVLTPLKNWSINKDGKEVVYFDKNFISKLHLGQRNFSEVIKILETKYNYQIKYPEKCRRQKVTGTLEGNLWEILEIIGYTFNLKPVENVKDGEISLQ